MGGGGGAVRTAQIMVLYIRNLISEVNNINQCVVYLGLLVDVVYEFLH